MGTIAASRCRTADETDAFEHRRSFHWDSGEIASIKAAAHRRDRRSVRRSLKLGDWD